jgi:hypothetical protein
MNKYQECHMEIEGNVLTPGQSMTIRVAIESFAESLAEQGLGNDDHGKMMVKGYMDNIISIRKFMYGSLDDS